MSNRTRPVKQFKGFPYTLGKETHEVGFIGAFTDYRVVDLVRSGTITGRELALVWVIDWHNGPDNPKPGWKATNKELSELVSSCETHVSRMLRKLKEHGLVQISGYGDNRFLRVTEKVRR